MFKRLFEPISIGSITLKNRIIMPAISTNLAPLGAISQRMIDYHVVRAKGGAGLIIFQSGLPVILTSDSASNADTAIPDISVKELRTLTEPVKMAGSKIGIQFVHTGAQGIADFAGKELVAPSPVPCRISREIPRELTIKEIASLIRQFTDSAQKAKDAGFDLVEIHGAHGYLISEFLSGYSNKRKDSYGGTYENMARFPCEIISHIKLKLGHDFTVGIRINGNDFAPGGITIEDAKSVVPYLVEAGADYISVSAGVYGASKTTIPPMMEARGIYTSLAGEIKKISKVPVVTVGRINNPELAEEILEKGLADIIAMGRALIADPELPNKAKQNDLQNIRKCIACNQGCIDRINKTILPGKDDGKDSYVTCLVNPRAGREAELLLKPAKKKKKVLVAGGGPAGMEFARIAAQRGHLVTLFEKSNKLGGQLNLAAKIPFKKEIQEEIDYLSYQLKRVKVDTVLGKKADIKTINNLSPDVIIIATGSIPVIPDTGNSIIKTATAWDILGDKTDTGNNILIIGGGSVGLETAYYLACQEKKVTVVEQLKNFAIDMGPISRFYLRERLNTLGVILMKLTKFIEISDQGVIVENNNKKSLIQGIDTIVWAVGATPDKSLADKLKGKYDFFIIGDADKPEDALSAIEQAHRTALVI